LERFIFDFYCPEAKLAIELDGAYHQSPEQAARDQERDVYVYATYGITTLRFNNDQITNDLSSTLSRIIAELPCPGGTGLGGASDRKQLSAR
jgi:very-short-patch-repair endonuclease